VSVQIDARFVEAARNAHQKLMTPPRKATKPTAGSKARRLEAKTRRGAVKRLRGGAIDD